MHPLSFLRRLRESIQKHRNETAVLQAGQAFTYDWLDRRSAQVWNALQARGIGPGRRVGICQSRSPDMVAAVVGILRAGAAYVPLDPSYPRERLRAMAEMAELEFVLAGDEWVALVREIGNLPLCLAKLESSLEPSVGGAWATAADERSAVYVLFTSGSTGRPKGVVMGRGALDNLIDWQIRSTASLGTGAGARTLQFAPLSFDVHFQELFATLCAGGTMVLVSDGERLDPERLLAVIDGERVERLFLPFVALDAMAETASARGVIPKSLKEVITAGEQLRVTPALARCFASLPECRLVNQYGPTETHVVTAHSLTGDPAKWPALPPIGRAIDGVQVELLGPDLEPVKPGEPGEIFVSGVALAEGYLGTDEGQLGRFATVRGVRRYRTGDLGAWNSGGELEFLGRADEQVKIRGYRIEVGEIESVLAAHPAVRQVAVKAVRSADGNEPYLAAHIVPREGHPGVAELSAWLGERLPEYMVPRRTVFADALPLTPSGKVDRHALPDPIRSRPDLAREFAAPKTEIERQLALLWGEMLEVEPVGVRDSFFDLGGTSLAAVRLVERMRRELDVDVSVTRLFEEPTIAGLVASLDRESFERKEPVSGVQDEEVLEDVAASGIAVIGLAGRFPGARDVGEFWRNLAKGVESISFFSETELDPSIPRAVRSDPAYVRARGVLEDADQFDAVFFGMAPLEAEVTDPQQRVFLELAWEALENSGYAPNASGRRVGVFAGSHNNSYLVNNVLRRPDLAGRFGEFPTMLANEKDYLATRVAYKLGLTGPAVTVLTACSTSLVAVAQAVASLLAGHCDLALAGGVAITSPPASGHLYQEGAMLSGDGHCRPFDADASGTVFSDGAGIVVLKRLRDALRDGDMIRAVIRGAAVNNDGADKMSFTAPSVKGQASAIQSALVVAGVEAESIGYVEAHGTATPLGDPIEIAALANAFSTTARKQYCALGSLKGNLGHLTAAAGVAGLMKVILALENELIPESLFFSSPNPRIDFAESPFFVNARPRPWRRGPVPRRAGVSSFGVGGTNAHLIVEEAPVAVGERGTDKERLIVLSARTSAALAEARRRLADELERTSHSLADIALTLQAGRAPMRERYFVVAANTAEAARRLRGDETDPGERTERRERLESMGRRWQGGESVDWAGLYEGERPRRVPLPTYPFERRRYWADPPIAMEAAAVTPPKGGTIVANRSAGAWELVKAVLEEVSGIELADAGGSACLFDLGFDSLALTQAANAFTKRLGVTVSFRQLMEDLTTLEALTTFVGARLPREKEESPKETKAPAPAKLVAIESNGEGSTLEAVIARQLDLMARQLELLRGGAPVADAIEAERVEPNERDAVRATDDIASPKPFGAAARVNLNREALPERQRAFIAELAERYCARTKRSKELTEANRPRLADPRVVSGFRPTTKELVYPIIVERSSGSKLWDVDGNEYVDLTCGFGSCFLGHRAPVVTEAVARQLERGYEIGPQHPLAGRVAARIAAMTAMERVSLCNTGSEAVLGAVRLARTVTGRSRIALFQGSYHGINDEVIVRGAKGGRSFPAAPGIPDSAVENVVVLDYGTDEALARLEEVAGAGDLAAVLVEPVQSRRPDLQPRDFLHAVRRLCDRTGTALVFDEVITGFRIHPGGAQAYFGVRADLATYGKVVGGGLPIGVIAGKREFMDALDGGEWQYGDDSFPRTGMTYFAGTFVRHPLALAAADAVLETLEQAGPDLYAALGARTEHLVNIVNTDCIRAGAPVRLAACGSLFKIAIEPEEPLGELLHTLLRHQGVHAWDHRPCFLTTAHTDADVDHVIEAFRQSVRQLQDVGILLGGAKQGASRPANGPERSPRAGHNGNGTTEPPVPGARLGRDPRGKPAWYVSDPQRPGKYVLVGEVK